MMYGFTRAVENQGYSVVILSGDPDSTHRDFNIRAFDRRSGSQVDRAIAECDALVFPGGSVFQDVTSVKSVFYYANLIKKAKAAKKKVLMLGQGVGPLTTFLGKRTAAQAFQMVDVLAVRDPTSVQTLHSIGVKGKVHVSADPAFLLLPGPRSDEEGGFAVGGMRVCGIAPRPLKGRDVATLIGEFCRLLYQSGTMPVLIAMDTVEDRPLNDAISKRQGGRIPDIHKSQTPMQIQQRMSRMDCVVAMRLHAGILATTVDIPTMMISYDPKVSAFARTLDIGPALSLEGLTAQRMLDQFTAFSKDRERNVKIVARKREELIKLAGKNIELLLETVPVGAKS